MRLKFKGIPRFAVLLAVAISAFEPSLARAADYLLGPEDKVRLRVDEWRPGSNEVHEWSALGGEFKIGGSGTVSIPLIGEMQAVGLTSGQLAAAISDRLWKKIGLTMRPDATVEVAQYRPFFILGGVNKPGDYAYSPSLTVMKAVSVAGGLLRRADDFSAHFEREALSNKGELGALLAERDSLVVRRSRLEAESQQAATLTFPPEIIARRGDPDISKFMRDEQALWDTRQSALRSQITSFQESRTLLEQEVTSMSAKDVTLSHQADLAQTELTNVKGLVSKGYVVASRQIDLEQSAAQFASARLDLDIAMLRAKQDMAAAERSIHDLQDQRRAAVLLDLHDIRSKIASNRERIKTVRKLLYDAEVTMPQDYLMRAQNDAKPPTFIVTRQVGDVTASLELKENDEISPGDTLRVVLPGPAALEGERGAITLENSETIE